jgi:hypothetical protein
MTLAEFTSLPPEQQMDVIRNNSVYLCNRKTDNYTHFLYQTDAFYIEVTYDQAANKIVQLLGFQSTLLLEPYLNQIKLKHIS